MYKKFIALTLVLQLLCGCGTLLVGSALGAGGYYLYDKHKEAQAQQEQSYKEYVYKQQLDNKTVLDFESWKKIQ